jgi:hypothetical protein
VVLVLVLFAHCSLLFDQGLVLLSLLLLLLQEQCSLLFSSLSLSLLRAVFAILSTVALCLRR